MRRTLLALPLVVLSALVTASPALAGAGAPTIRINEVRLDQPGADNDEYLELRGAAGASLDGLTYVVIGDGVRTIRALVELVAETCGFTGEIRWDPSRPDGQPRRCVDASRASELLGWRAETRLADGLRATVDWYRANRTHRAGYNPSIAGGR